MSAAVCGDNFGGEAPVTWFGARGLQILKIIPAAVETADAASITSISPSQVPVVQQPAVTLGDSLLYDTDRNQPNMYISIS